MRMEMLYSGPFVPADPFNAPDPPRSSVQPLLAGTRIQKKVNAPSQATIVVMGSSPWIIGVQVVGDRIGYDLEPLGRVIVRNADTQAKVFNGVIHPEIRRETVKPIGAGQWMIKISARCVDKAYFWARTLIEVNDNWANVSPGFTTDRGLIQTFHQTADSELAREVSTDSATVAELDTSFNGFRFEGSLLECLRKMTGETGAVWAINGDAQCEYNSPLIGGGIAAFQISDNPAVSGERPESVSTVSQWRNPTNFVGVEWDGTPPQFIQDAGSIATYGTLKTIVRDKSIKVQLDAQKRAVATSDANRFALLGVRYTTYKDGLDINRIQSVTLLALGVSTQNLLINSLTIAQRTGDLTEYRVEAGNDLLSVEFLLNNFAQRISETQRFV